MLKQVQHDNTYKNETSSKLGTCYFIFLQYTILMLNLNSLMIGSMQPKVLGEFYEKVFGRKADMEEGGWYGWQVGSIFFSVGEHSEMKGKTKDPGRMMFNLETKDVEKEFERIKKAGAIVAKEPYGMGGGMIATLADPDGNYFQLMTPWEDMETSDKN